MDEALRTKPVDYKLPIPINQEGFYRIREDCDAGLAGEYVKVVGGPQGGDTYDPLFPTQSSYDAPVKLLRYHNLEPVDPVDEGLQAHHRKLLGDDLYDLLIEMDAEIAAEEDEPIEAPTFETAIEMLTDGTVQFFDETGGHILDPTDTLYVQTPYLGTGNTPIEFANDEWVLDPEVIFVEDPYKWQGEIKDEGTGGHKRDAGKTRFDLLPYSALKGAADIFTFGADKYDVDEEGNPLVEVYGQNWRKGMRWGRVYAAMQRHLNDWFAGEDLDPESGKSHLDHALCCLMMLKEYTVSYMQGDDRPTPYRRVQPVIGLDVDGVLCDLYPVVLKRAKSLVGPEANGDMHHYAFRDSLIEALSTMTPEELRAVQAKEDGSTLPFEPVAYITARYGAHYDSVEEWLAVNGFPYAPVIHAENKATVCKELGIDVFVDDKYDHFVELQSAGVACFLMDAPYNRKHEVGTWRVKNLAEVAQKLGLQ